jgi:hypothetical protein
MKHLHTLLAVIAGLALASRRFLFGDERLIAANTNPANCGIHEDGQISRLPDAVLASRHLLVKVGSDGDHVAVNGVHDMPLGSVPDTATQARVDEGLLPVTVLLLGRDDTKLMVASEAITAGVDVYTAASGKVSTLSASAGSYYKVGKALTAAAADGDQIEVADCAPILKVVFAQTQDTLTDSTGGTGNTTLVAIGATNSGDRSSDINNNFADIAAQLAKIKADMANALTR